MDKQSKKRYIIIWVGVVLLALLATMPNILSSIGELRLVSSIKGYTDSVYNIDEEELEKMKQDIVNYNEEIYKSQQTKYFRYTGAGPTNLNDEYYKLLNPGNDGMMCTLSIPKIRLNLPVVHGTQGDNLGYELGHMYGTSLPWSGENVHSVIAGHSGLKSADLFTNLDKLKVGDRFYIYALDEVNEYTVDNVVVVTPEEEAAYLQVQDGANLCTLYTCTPIGVNSHRLLVRGQLTNSQKYIGADGENTIVKRFNKEALLKLLMWLSIPACLFIIGLIRYIVKNKKKKLEDENVKETKETDTSSN